MAQQIKITQTSNADMNIGVPKNLTAVEWLWNVLADKGYFKKLPISEIKQAKQMEKEQIKKAYKDYHDLGHIYGLETEQYYNEQYGK